MWAQRYAKRVTVIPTTIDAQHYQARDRPPSEQLWVGWSGSPTTIVHLRLLESVLRRLATRARYRIRVSGDASFRIDGAEVESVAWRAASEVTDLSVIDIGVMPCPMMNGGAASAG